MKNNKVSTVASITLRDLRKMVGNGIEMNRDSVRNLVNTYYDIQEYRITIENRIRAASKGNEEDDYVDVYDENGIKVFNPEHDSLSSYSDYMISLGLRELEGFIKNALKAYVDSDPIGQWCTSIMGIGPVIAAGLISYIDISKCPTAGHIWSYAGITGKEKKIKGEKINYNPKFKTLCWKLGESFIKSSNRPNDIYGHLYKEKKEWYQNKNNNGGFSERANYLLKTQKIGKDSALFKTYSDGKISDGHINNMARRFAVKIFLSHLHEIWYEYENGCKAPNPFVKDHMGHVHIISAPNREIIFKN